MMDLSFDPVASKVDHVDSNYLILSKLHAKVRSEKMTMTIHPIPLINKLGNGHLFKISRFKEKIKKTRPHKHEGYYELIYLSQGEGFHWVDTERYTVNPPEIYFLKPGSLHCCQFTSIPKGYVILFREEFFDQINEATLMEMIQLLDNLVRVSLSGQVNDVVIFEEILKESSEDYAYADHIIYGYLQVLLSKVLRESQIQKKNSPAHFSLYHRFIKLLTEKYPGFALVNEYARLLDTSPQNLNASCRKHAAKSASEIITQQVLLEAKRHILHTENTISEIAYSLKFSDVSYFIKFFKRLTGATPVEFRNNYFQ